MSINTRENYMEIGTSVNSDNSLANSLQLPVPTTLTVAPQFLADAGRNAGGTMILQQIGRIQYTGKATWAKLTNKWHWKINRWFETYGMAFYLKYFDQNTGMVKIQRFYKGAAADVSPSETTEDINGYKVPTHYKNYMLSFIDMGEDDVIIVESLEV